MSFEASHTKLFLDEFSFLTKRHAFFHAFFILAALAQASLFLILIPFLANTWWLAALLTLIFVTVFVYLALRIYMKARKPEQLDLLKERFMIASAAPRRALLEHVIEHLENHHAIRYELPPYLNSFQPLANRFSMWCHWEDIVWIKQQLYGEMLKEALEGVKTNPFDVPAHQILAEILIRCYHVYDPPPLEEALSRTARHNAQTNREFFARSAIEELKAIMSLPRHSEITAWAILELANTYRDLGMHEEEKQSYQQALSINPGDSHVLYRLGKLHFDSGELAEGLRMYQILKEQHDALANTLIKEYGSHL